MNETNLTITSEDKQILSALAAINLRAQKKSPVVFEEHGETGATGLLMTMSTLLNSLVELGGIVDEDSFNKLCNQKEEATKLSEYELMSIQNICYIASRYRYEILGYFDEFLKLSTIDKHIEDMAVEAAIIDIDTKSNNK